MPCVREILKRAVSGGFEEGHEEGDEKDKKVEQGEGEASPREKSRKPQKEEKPENVCRDHASFAVEPVCQGAIKGPKSTMGIMVIPMRMPRWILLFSCPELTTHHARAMEKNLSPLRRQSGR